MFSGEIRRVSIALAAVGLVVPAVALQVGAANAASTSSDQVMHGKKSKTKPVKYRRVKITNLPVARAKADVGWKVRKEVDRRRVTVDPGGSADFTYRVLLQALGVEVYGYTLGGTATVNNRNTLPMVVTLSATVTGGAACTFPSVPDVSPDPGLQVDLPPGLTDFAYVCDPAPEANGSTTARVDWDPVRYPENTPGAGYTASDEQPYVYEVTEVTDTTTTVTDTFMGGSGEVLGTFDIADVWAAPDHTVVVKTYTRTIDGTPGECRDYLNVAHESADDTSDEETVTVCEPEVAPEQASAKPRGKVRASCQGTVRATLNNRSFKPVTYKLRVGKKTYRVKVKAETKRKVVRKGHFRNRVVLKMGKRVLDRTRIPARCAPPETLPDTGLRHRTAARSAAQQGRWR